MSTRDPKRLYAHYLASPGWQQRRQEALWRAQRRCQSPICDLAYLRSLTDAELAVEIDEALPPHAYRLHVHHLTYERLGHEHPDDLIVLCPACHAGVHDREYADEPFTKSMTDALVEAITRMAIAFQYGSDA